jgi:hypothetical protein
MSHGIRGSQLANMLLRMFQAFSATPEGRAACADHSPCPCTAPPKVAARNDVPAPPSTPDAFKKAPVTPRDQRLDAALRKGIAPVKETK